MNHLEVLFSAVFFFFCCDVKAEESNSHKIHSIHPSLGIVIGILTAMFFLTFLILACAKFCHTDLRNGPIHEQGPHVLLHSRSRFSGFDKKAIDSLPFFRFSSLKGSKEGLECVVCLSKFEDSETLRLLPKCRHAFHMNCIDKWLERHSSCPLCRYKFDIADLTSFTYTNSLRYLQNGSNLEEGSSLELFVRREQDSSSSRSLRFINLGSSFRKFGKSSKKEEVLIQYGDRMLLDKFKHRIIVSDIVCKSRWSDVNSSDLMLLNSEMLNLASNKRFSSLDNELSMDEQVMKVKEDMEKKRLYESRFSKITRSNSWVSTSGSPTSSNVEANQNSVSRALNPAEKRSMSEITHVSRFKEFSTRKDEKIRSVWLPIARRTVQWFAGEERNSLRPPT